MPLQLDTMSARTRTKHTNVGRSFGSPFVLDQTDDSLLGLEKLGPELEAKLVDYGWAASDKQDLIDGRQALLDSGVEREAAKAEAAAITQAFHRSLKRGKAARRQVRSVLERAQDILEDRGNEAAAQAIEVALRGNAKSGADAGKLEGQLQALRIPLARTDVAEVTADRGGPSALAALDAATAELRDIQQLRPTKRGTPAETERLDLIDGILVDRLRALRAATRELSIALGQPWIAELFELKALYGRKRTSSGGTGGGSSDGA